ncbi:MAG: trypsin-like peptidase domain-containing protein [Bacilli bacterium]|nr:trypsin-like peptidase domain-containing protein [Bacilli bacterium]MDD3422132.1 trypsin-like peptidase domain-containing protein [Bacilli bacterium]MDD4065526.1 trypsin-like peptidase domain-containing protein [Bacilli bacterium]
MKRYQKITTLIVGIALLTGCSFLGKLSDYATSSNTASSSSSTSSVLSGETFCSKAVNTPANYATTKVGTTKLSFSASDIYQEAKDSTVIVNACYAVGSNEYNYITSGFVYTATDNTYYIITNASGIFHRYYSNDGSDSNVKVVKYGDYEITFEDGRRYTSNLVGSFDGGDLAVFSVTTTDEIKVATIGSSDSLQVGDGVIAIGTPSLGENLMNTIVRGVVSGLNRREIVYFDTTVNNMSRSFDIANYEAFQFDAPINGGMEGGPVYNSNGEVIGMLSYKYTNSTSSVSYESVSMSIPLDNLKNPIDDIIKTGSYTRPTIGVTVSDVDQFSLSQLTSNNIASGLYTGCYISEVSSGSAAAKAGMKKGETVIEIGGVATENMSVISGQLQRYDIGDTLVIKTMDSSGATHSYTLTF